MADIMDGVALPPRDGPGEVRLHARPRRLRATAPEDALTEDAPKPEPPDAAGRTAPDGGSGPTGVRALAEALRVPHWIKNAFVLVPLLFSGTWNRPAAWGMALGALAAFCLLSSAVYLVNDIADRDSDRAHAAKRRRPIASGRLSPTAAGLAAGVLMLLAGGVVAVETALLRGPVLPYEPVVAMGGFALAAWSGGYVLLNLAYSLALKSKPILDVLMVAMGFVLRAMAGAAAIAVPISPWLVLCTLTLCLFIALAKRRGEIAALGEGAARSRRVHRFYTLGNLEHMLAVSAGLAIATYSLYCLAERTVRHVGSAQLIWTVPLVAYGMFRFYCLTLNRPGEDPHRLLLRDRVMWLVVGLWVVLVVLILRFGRSPFLEGILS